MDSNDNSNQSAPAVYLDITDVKREPNEDSSGETDNINQAIYLDLQKVHGISENNLNENSISGVKRKNSEENSLNMQEDDRMSDVTISSNVVVKRRRYSDSQCGESVTNSNDNLNTNSLQCKEERVIHTLFVTNSPGEWTSEQIIDYIREECGINISKINDSREGNSDSDFQIKLKFANKEQLTRVQEKLQEREAEGKLKVYTDEVEAPDNDVESDTMAQNDERESVDANAPPIQDPEQIELASDENGFYIREEYLNSLGIKMPITNWVTVTNFRCDKSELKEVLELAGKVLICHVISISNKYANIMYSHPLEAVQAISMLNGQKLYGQSLKLTMNNLKDSNMLLPKGLADVGPGLGKYGKGLPDLVEQFNRFVIGQKSSIDARLFQPELLRKIGIDLERDCPTPIVRSVASNSSSNHVDNTSEHGSDISQSDSNTVRNNGNQFGVIGQRIMQRTNSTTSTPSTPQFHNNRVSTFTPLNQPVIIRGTNGTMMGSRGPNSPMPIPSGSMQGPRHLTPAVPNSMPVYPNCPPIPGVDTSNTLRGSYNISVISSTPMPVIPGPIMTRGPMPSPMPSSMVPMRRPVSVMTHMSAPTNRFPGPGPRNIGPMIGQRGPAPVSVQNPNIPVSSPIRPNGPVPLRPFMPHPTTISNVQMFKGADPVTIQISNLPPSTNFVNLGQKLSEFGHVVFLEFTTPGCAVVRFASPSDADRCLQNYRNVLG